MQFMWILEVSSFISLDFRLLAICAIELRNFQLKMVSTLLLLNAYWKTRFLPHRNMATHVLHIAILSWIPLLDIDEHCSPTEIRISLSYQFNYYVITMVRILSKSLTEVSRSFLWPLSKREKAKNCLQGTFLPWT